MSTVEDLEKAVAQLAPGDLARFRAWFDSFDAARFDERIARDGKFDRLAEDARAAHRAHRSRDL